MPRATHIRGNAIPDTVKTGPMQQRQTGVSQVFVNPVDPVNPVQIRRILFNHGELEEHEERRSLLQPSCASRSLW